MNAVHPGKKSVIAAVSAAVANRGAACVSLRRRGERAGRHTMPTRARDRAGREYPLWVLLAQPSSRWE